MKLSDLTAIVSFGSSQGFFSFQGLIKIVASNPSAQNNTRSHTEWDLVEHYVCKLSQ